MARAHCPQGCERGTIKKGYYVCRWNNQPVPRYLCKGCGQRFSSRARLATYRQKKPHLNEAIFQMYASAMTQRRIARNLRINRKTVVRKFLFLAGRAREAHEEALAKWGAVAEVQFDEMESFEHTRLKPLTIAFAVEASSGRLLETRVASIPAKGRLAAISRQKYGFRRNDGAKARAAVLSQVARVAPHATIVTDAHPAYPSQILTLLPNAKHVAVATRFGKRFRPEGSRKNVDDALFALNHMAAKLRHDLSRLMRKVWVTTKKTSRLQDHLALYRAFHNQYPLLA